MSDPSPSGVPASPAAEGEVQAPTGLRKGPLSFLSGAITSALLAWLSFATATQLSQALP